MVKPPSISIQPLPRASSQSRFPATDRFERHAPLVERRVVTGPRDQHVIPLDVPVPLGLTTSGPSRRRRDGGEGTSRARCSVDASWCGAASLGAALLVVLCFVVLLTLRRHLKDLLLWLEGLDVLESTLLFAVAFVAVSFPWGWGYIALNLAAGYLYGFLHGLAIVVAGVLVGTLVAHFGCRWWVPGVVAVLARRSKTLGAVVRLLETGSGLKVIALARLTPIPFGLQNAMFSFCISVALMLYVVRRARQELEAIASYGNTNIAHTDGDTHPVAFTGVEDV
uniref:transmembrane protein 64 n=1 Tax=Myxine glutinosa TaxID=7769 RepID=UPI00358F89A3